MITLIFSFLFIFLSSNVSAWDDDREYLQVGPGFTEEIYGDGFEAGFELSVTVNNHDAEIQAPMIFIENDSADCSPSEFTLLSKQPSFKLPNGPQYYDYTFAASVSTAVNGDTGGCVAIARKSDDSRSEILKIVIYGYTTDY